MLDEVDKDESSADLDPSMSAVMYTRARAMLMTTSPTDGMVQKLAEDPEGTLSLHVIGTKSKRHIYVFGWGGEHIS